MLAGKKRWTTGVRCSTGRDGHTSYPSHGGGESETPAATTTKLIVSNINIAIRLVRLPIGPLAPPRPLWIERRSTIHTLQYKLCLPSPTLQVKPTWSWLINLVGDEEPPTEEAKAWVQTTPQYHSGNDCWSVQLLEISMSSCHEERFRHMFHTTSIITSEGIF